MRKEAELRKSFIQLRQAWHLSRSRRQKAFKLLATRPKVFDDPASAEQALLEDDSVACIVGNNGHLVDERKVI